MKLKFKIEGLDCANCANKLEDTIRKQEEVTNVSISFMSQKMIIKTNTNNLEEFIKKIETIIKKEEPDVTITLK